MQITLLRVCHIFRAEERHANAKPSRWRFLSTEKQRPSAPSLGRYAVHSILDFMSNLLHHSLTLLVVLIIFYYLFPADAFLLSSPLPAHHLSRQCLPSDIRLFAELSCSPDGASFRPARGDRSGVKAPTAQPKLTALYRPWSYEPVCTVADGELCVYTSVEYADGRGISIVTSPEIARNIALLSPFQDYTALDEHVIIGNIVVAPRTLSKGRVALARHELKGGDSIASNVPVIVASHELDELSSLEREEVLRAAILRLPIATQRLIARATWDSDDDDDDGDDALIYGFCNQHAGFPINVGGQDHFALYPELSYFNHACSPKSVLPKPAEDIKCPVAGAAANQI